MKELLPKQDGGETTLLGNADSRVRIRSVRFNVKPRKTACKKKRGPPAMRSRSRNKPAESEVGETLQARAPTLQAEDKKL